MAYKNAVAKVGDVVLVYKDEDRDVLACKVYQVKRELDGFGNRNRPIMRWHYYVKPCNAKDYPNGKRGFVVRDRDIAYVQAYVPHNFDIVRHFKFIEDNLGYEMLMDFLHTVKVRGRHHHALEQLQELVENVMLSIEGDSGERYKANNDIEVAMR